MNCCRKLGRCPGPKLILSNVLIHFLLQSQLEKTEQVLGPAKSETESRARRYRISALTPE
jgi:hypothetical protein